jgi:trimeric autotransporter adhesin
MKSLIQFQTKVLSLFGAPVLACLLFAATGQGVTPPPDGGYPGQNTAEGTQALNSIILPVPVRGGELGALRNTANGYQTLFSLTTSSDNTATGYQALFSITTGNGNTAMGAGALLGLGTGSNNTAVGFNANTNGFNLHNNTIVGANADGGALETTVIGANAQAGFQQNTVVGFKASGGDSSNTVIGAFAGSNLGPLTEGNIDIGNSGFATDSLVIRIGEAQTKTYIAGIFGASVPGVAVYVNSSGQLGVAPSSQRLKEEIKPMDKASEAILALKPVTFRYKKEVDADRTPQFGLVAEEVEKINPDLVVRDADGKPYTVRYEAVNAMLLNEFLKEHRTVQELKSAASKQEAKVTKQEATIAKQQKQIEALTTGLQKVSAQLEASKPAPQVVNNQ